MSYIHNIFPSRKCPRELGTGGPHLVQPHHQHNNSGRPRWQTRRRMEAPGPRRFWGRVAGCVSHACVYLDACDMRMWGCQCFSFGVLGAASVGVGVGDKSIKQHNLSAWTRQSHAGGITMSQEAFPIASQFMIPLIADICYFFRKTLKSGGSLGCIMFNLHCHLVPFIKLYQGKNSSDYKIQFKCISKLNKINTNR